ncbi:cupin fold WbuC family metalloprotein [Sphingomonas naasensis]|uniref:Cupin fold metalloprotein, WbuC family n=1 Tax=Sphingomonas naasensis TaxID=1344951 RepID=A0A4S1WSV0_9SPHN|nr:WbuC family cupin fold metalloprotein [Sphingomonas naasensis]NIJ19316.1 cupin fold WbuC family metalloprotein [Sphingomonas naasensis]TGX46489.1 cupin fold metalloprotein, WbuC family [Sphingomonas naasensis]
MIPAITTELLDSLLEQARQSPRLRQHHNLHASYADPCQRLLNVILAQSYIRPHRHRQDPKAETLFALSGVFKVLTFDSQGTPASVTLIGPAGTEKAVGTCAIEVAPDEWHTAIALTESAVLLEMKAGPFNPDAPKEAAPWAPAEGSPEAQSYLDMLRLL